MSSLDPHTEKRKAAKAKSARILDRLGVKELELNEHEEVIAAEVIHPSDITTKFEDIGGLDHIVSSLRESVIYPLCYPELFASNAGLLGAPKALAKESGATFINIAVSVLSNKWYGESNKLVAGLFSLARKMQPSIIFIDEIDSFLGERGRGDHEVTGMMKAEFMTLWDGLASGEDTRILVLGATNRPNDIDQAILRRMPKRFAMLKGANLERNFSIRELAKRTDGLSGSDLKEACRNAAMVPVREYMRTNGGSHEDMRKAQAEGFKLRPLTMRDFFAPDGTTQPAQAAYGIAIEQPALD
ncbi:AAA family ATPase [Ceratobasidium sp. AG-Ba]|nr:AAA family ATPase [Ceratobasidium sp. AG-Ba]